MGWRELCLLVVCLAAWRGAALAAAAAPSWNCTSLDRVPQAFFAQRSELAVNATTPLAAGAHASFACLQFRADDNEYELVQNHYMSVAYEYSVTPQGAPTDVESEWQLEVLFASTPEGFQSKRQLEQHTFHELRGRRDLSLMVPRAYRLYAAFALRCTDAVCPTKGDVAVKMTLQLHQESCDFNRSRTEDCERCVRQEGCGYCDANTNFPGCWHGSADGPDFDNRVSDGVVCGTWINRPAEAEAIPRWTFEFADGRDRCARRTGGDLYVVLTALVLVGGVIVCVVCAVQAYRQRESTAGSAQRPESPGPGAIPLRPVGSESGGLLADDGPDSYIDEHDDLDDF